MKKPNPKTKLDEREWNFSSMNDGELVACCYWEYARESNAIRCAVRIVKTAIANQGKSALETVRRQKFRVVATRAYGLLHQTGLPLEFWTELPFPETPWQHISETERKKWAHVCPEIPSPVKFPPFQVTGDLFVASWLYGEARKAYDVRLSGEPPPPVEMRGMGGVDSFIAQINWREFSKKEIKKSLNKWVDEYSCPVAKTSERGRPVDSRARLESLGLLRLRKIQSVEETIETISETLPADKRTATKYHEPGELNREAQNAAIDFRSLFHFLDPAKMPRCWPDGGLNRKRFAPFD